LQTEPQTTENTNKLIFFISALFLAPQSLLQSRKLDWFSVATLKAGQVTPWDPRKNKQRIRALSAQVSERHSTAFVHCLLL
jgi:hypothetical protein